MTQEALKLALNALEYHASQTRPIYQTDQAITAIKEALAQPEQEPVKCNLCDDSGIGSFGVHSMCICQYAKATPPQRKPLSDKAITQVIDSMPRGIRGWMSDWDLYEFARAIEAKLKETT